MIDNTYVNDSKIHGKGLFASGSIPAGGIIGWLRGKPSDIDGPYVFWIGEWQSIEVLCYLKYINHSDDPNVCYYDDRSVVALRDIEPYEEITHNYYSNDW